MNFNLFIVMTLDVSWSLPITTCTTQMVDCCSADQAVVGVITSSTTSMHHILSLLPNPVNLFAFPFASFPFPFHFLLTSSLPFPSLPINFPALAQFFSLVNFPTPLPFHSFPCPPSYFTPFLSFPQFTPYPTPFLSIFLQPLPISLSLPFLVHLPTPLPFFAFPSPPPTPLHFFPFFVHPYPSPFLSRSFPLFPFPSLPF